MEYEFKSLRELYDRITPALTSKRSELKRVGFYHIKEADIWNYLTSNKWLHAHHLTISEMVSDIFDASNDDINNYMIKKTSLDIREPNFDD